VVFPMGVAPAGEIRWEARGGVGRLGILSRGGTALVPAGARGGEAPACKTCIAG
jgi:hypothetical protein